MRGLVSGNSLIGSCIQIEDLLEVCDCENKCMKYLTGSGNLRAGLLL